MRIFTIKILNRAVHKNVQKMEILGIACYGIEDAKFYTVLRVFKGQWHRGHVLQYRNSNGNLCVRYLYFDGNRWNWNYNWLDNDWNGNNPAVCLATLFISLLLLRESFVL